MEKNSSNARSFLYGISHFATRVKNGYMQYYDSLSNSWQWVHRKIAEIAYGPIPKGHEVHHINKNKLDNSPENLVQVSKEEHKRIHQADSDNLDRIIAKLNKIKKNEYSKKLSAETTIPKIDRSISDNISKDFSHSINKGLNTPNFSDLLKALIVKNLISGNSGYSCWKCGGSGYLPEYNHIAGGICFACNGASFRY